MSKQYYNEWRKATKGEDPTTSESEESSGSSGEESSQEVSPDEKQAEKTQILLQTASDIADSLNYIETFNGQNPLLTQTTNNSN